MDQFIRHNRDLLISTLYLLIGLFAFGYVNLYQPAKIGFLDISIVNSEARKESDALKKQVAKAVKDAKDVKEDVARGVRQMPDFLRRINAIANAHNVIIRRLVPTTESRFKFKIDIVTDYWTFLRFTSDLESLNTVVHNLEVHPYNPDPERPEHLISFSITPRNDAEPLSGARLDALREDVRKKVRNPFQRFAYDKSRREVRAEIELTWIHKLTGIGQTAAGPQATIDNRDFRVGDTLLGKRITEIRSDRVYLVSDRPVDGVINKYVLKFRGNK
ncbi:MAG: hypothetical protein ACPGUC_05030 [Gammaproteobacteria bacterium]